MRSAIAILVLVIAFAIGARSCAEKEKKLLVKRAPEPPTKVAAARHPASPFQWTMTEKGLGPVQLGMKREDVETAVGEPFRVGPGGRDRCGNADWPGAPAGVSVVIGNGVVRRIQVDPYSAGLATDAGVAIGTDSQTLANVYTALGKPILPSARSGIVIINLTPGLTPASALSVSFMNHRVFGFELGYLHEIDNGNVCG